MPDSLSLCHGKIIMIPASALGTRRKQVYSTLWPTQGNLQLATSHASFLFSGWESETLPHLHCPPIQPQHTNTVYTVKFTLRPFKLLDKESLIHTHSHRIQSQEITGLQKTSILLLLIVSPAPLLYIFWMFPGFGQRFCWICFLWRKEFKPFVHGGFKIVSSSKWFSHSLNSMGLGDTQYPEIPVLCYRRQRGRYTREGKRRWRLWFSRFSVSGCRNRDISHIYLAIAFKCSQKSLGLEQAVW